MGKNRDLRAYKEEIFRGQIQNLVVEKIEVLGNKAHKKAIAMAIAKDLGLEDYMGLYKVIYSLGRR